MAYLAFPAIVLSVLLFSTGCSAEPPLRLTAGRETVTADGRGAPAPLVYSLPSPSAVDLYLVGPDGRRFYLRTGEQRPAGQEYQYFFDGTYPLPGKPEERRVLPDGSYRVVIEAVSAGRSQTAETRVSVLSSDSARPEIADLVAHPMTITPNFDGLEDAAAVTYRLTKRARVELFATDAEGKRAYVGPRVTREPGEYRDTWDGLDNRQLPLPPGSYQFSVKATDAAGNTSLAQTAIELAASGRPEARVINVNFVPRQLASGGTLQVEITVRNTGTTVLRTQGPDPGFTYSSYDTYATVLDRQFVDRAGVWRVGVDWAGSPAGAVAKYPYRWGFGRDLAPGEETTIEGRIRVEHGPLQDRAAGGQNNRVYFYAGLMQENMAFFDDKVGGAWIELGY